MNMTLGCGEVGVQYHYELVDRHGAVIDSWEDHNLVPLVGLNQITNAAFGDVSPIGTFYMGLFSNNYLPVMGATAADLPSVVGEFVGYSQATRPIWNRVSNDGVQSNAASRAEFTVSANARLYGGFLVSDATKGGGTGVLLSVARFSSPRDVEAGMTLRVRGDFSLIPTNVA